MALEITNGTTNGHASSSSSSSSSSSAGVAQPKVVQVVEKRSRQKRDSEDTISVDNEEALHKDLNSADDNDPIEVDDDDEERDIFTAGAFDEPATKKQKTGKDDLDIDIDMDMDDEMGVGTTQKVVDLD